MKAGNVGVDKHYGEKAGLWDVRSNGRNCRR